MADQGISYRRGPVESNYSRTQPTGIPSGAESYEVFSLAGDPVHGVLTGTVVTTSGNVVGATAPGPTPTGREPVTLIRSA